MKLTIEQSTLVRILSRVAGAVEKRNTIPILGHVLIAARDGQFYATGTDLDIEATAYEETGVTVLKEGACTVPMALFQPIAAKLRKGSLVTLESNGHTLTVTSGREALKLSALPIEDFPRIAGDDNYASITQIKADEFNDALARTGFAMAKDESRFYLKGIYIHAVDGNLAAVATDGHRLAYIRTGVESDAPGVILPDKAVAVIRSVGATGDAELSVSATKFRYKVDGATVIGKVIDGTYPDYRRVFPKDVGNRVTFDAADAAHAIGIVSMVSSERTKAVGINICADSVSFVVRDAVAGDGNSVIDAVAEGPELSIGLNSKYALDCMALADKGKVVISYGNDAMTPLMVMYDSITDYQVVVMPMRF